MDWFQNYKGEEGVDVIRWEDAKYAWKEVEKWQKQEDSLRIR